jgi:hypothetical protein
MATCRGCHGSSMSEQMSRTQGAGESFDRPRDIHRRELSHMFFGWSFEGMRGIGKRSQAESEEPRRLYRPKICSSSEKLR